MLTTTLSYNLISRDLNRAIEQKANQGLVSREIEYYLANISSVKTIDEFVDDSRLFNFAMRAHGLSDMAYAKAFMVKVLEEGIDEPGSFANGLTDPRFREFAETFNFVRYNEATTAFDRTQQGTVDRYTRQVLEEDAGAENPGVRLALYFERKASEITGPFDILGDRALLEVVQTVFSLPVSMSNQSIDKQAEMISSRIDFEDLKDPAKVSELLGRFTALWDVSNPQQTASAPTVAIGQPLQFGLSSNLLASLQNLRLGGR